MSSVKVLVFGEVNSKEGLNAAILKANKLHNGNNGPFGLLVIFGKSLNSIFPSFSSSDNNDESEQNHNINLQNVDDINVPDLPTYLLLNNINPSGPKYIGSSHESGKKNEDSKHQHQQHEQEQEQEDVTVLLDGKLTILKSAHGLLKTRSGVTVAWFGSNGNVWEQNNDDNKRIINNAISTFKKAGLPIDILLTRSYPNRITQGTGLDYYKDKKKNVNEEEPRQEEDPKQFINRCRDTMIVTSAVAPRYHFVSYSRDPYRKSHNENEAEIPSCFWERSPYYSALNNEKGKKKESNEENGANNNNNDNDDDDDDENDQKYTLSRFISLAPFTFANPDTSNESQTQKQYSFINKKLARYHYLFILRTPRPVPSSLSSLIPESQSTASSQYTPSPFDDYRNKDRDQDSQKRKRGDNSIDTNKKRQTTSLSVNPDSCFLCLSNPAIATHLIASVAEDTYMALARGPLVTPGGRHVMVVPLAHTPILPVNDDDDKDTKSNITGNRIDHIEARRIRAEEQQYLSSLAKTYLSIDDKKNETNSASSSSSSSLKSQVVVAFEISRSQNIHIHTQVIALPLGSVEGVVEAFQKGAEKYGYPSFEIIDENDDDDELTEEYLKISIYSGNKDLLKKDSSSILKPTTVIRLNLEGSNKWGDRSHNHHHHHSHHHQHNHNSYSRFNLQFPRRVLASYIVSQQQNNKDLNLKEEIISDWKKCIQSEEEEKKATQQIKSLFSQFDFTNEEK